MEDNRATLMQIYDEFAEQFQESILAIAKINPVLAKKINSRGYGLFNSDPRTTLTKGKMYVAALNPGGHDTSENSFYYECINSWDSNKLGSNAYYDEFWGQNNQFSLHQLNIRKILSLLLEKPEEEATRNSFATNLYFYKTPDQIELDKYPFEIKDCWKYHEKFLEIVQPEIILGVGNGDDSFFSELYRRRNLNVRIESFDLNPRRQVRAYRLDNQIVLGVPHLSRPYASIESILTGIQEVKKKL